MTTEQQPIAIPIDLLIEANFQVLSAAVATVVAAINATDPLTARQVTNGVMQQIRADRDNFIRQAIAAATEVEAISEEE